MDWDYVESGDIDLTCGTWVLAGGQEMHVSSATFHPGAILKETMGSSLYVDGPFTWNSASDCPDDPAIITSVNDDSIGEYVYISNSYPNDGEYGPALAVPAANLTDAQANITVYYGEPGIIENVPPPPVITVTASDSEATKGTGDHGAFTITRASWDLSQPVGVNFSFSGTAIPGSDYIAMPSSATIAADEDSVTITNFPLAQTGNQYRSSVIITLASGTNYSLGWPVSATLFILDPSAADPSPLSPLAGQVGWWRAETNALDSAGTNHGSLSGTGVGYGPGRVGQGFVLTVENDAVQLANPTNMQAQDLTIEGWIRRADPAVATAGGGGGGAIFYYFCGGYGVGLSDDGQLIFSRACYDAINMLGGTITDTNFHHIAVTKSGSTVVFWDNGTPYLGEAYDPGFWFSTLPAIGTVPSWGHSFWGTIDEMSIYNRGLSTNEVRAIFAADWAGKYFDSDANGLPDSWEMHYFGHIGVDPNADPDGDGLSNLAEYRGGTSPLSQNSVAGAMDEAFGVAIIRPGASPIP